MSNPRRNREWTGFAGPRAWWLVLVMAFPINSFMAHGQATAPVVRHRLVEGSTLLDDCPPCARPAVPMRLRGTFDLVGVESGPRLQRFRLDAIRWHADAWGGTLVRVDGHGELVVRDGTSQELRLDVRIADGVTELARRFTNTTPAIARALPNLAAELDAEEQTPVQVYRVSLRSAPVRELWFVTSHGFTPSKEGVPRLERRAAGDVLSMDGRLVAHNRVLTGRLGVMPVAPPMALGALDFLPGGPGLFSLREAVFSETLGTLTPGMLLTSDGRVFRTLDDLLGPFGTGAGMGKACGVDAAQVLPSGEVLFSTTSDVRARDGTLSHGDVLSGSGRVRWHGRDLLAPFGPMPPPGGTLARIGLDAWHEWPHGEAWFSVETGFQSAVAGTVGAGDVLSSHGWVVFRNLELLEGFQPLEDLADFGLEGLFIVTDLEAATGAPATAWALDAGRMVIRGRGPGRAWQLEATPRLGSTFRAVSAPTPFPWWILPTDGATGFVRVRAW